MSETIKSCIITFSKKKEKETAIRQKYNTLTLYPPSMSRIEHTRLVIKLCRWSHPLCFKSYCELIISTLNFSCKIIKIDLHFCCPVHDSPSSNFSRTNGREPWKHCWDSWSRTQSLFEMETSNEVSITEEYVFRETLMEEPPKWPRIHPLNSRYPLIKFCILLFWH